MKILFAASEMTPYAKTGGLGDVVGALPSALSRLGHEVTCCLPFYRCVRELIQQNPPLAPPQEGSGKNPPLAPPWEGSGAPSGCAPVAAGRPLLRIPLGDEVVTGEVLEWKQADGVRVLFIKCDQFFDRPELYQDGDEDYEDNAERFLFFSKAVAELAGDPRFRPDVVHCHDWQTALVPVLMRETHPRPPCGAPRVAFRNVVTRLPNGAHALRGRGARRIATVLTIHNMAFQGIFPAAAFELTNLPREFFTPAALEFYGRMNLMKGGIVFADAITTVSKTYAQEIQTSEGGFGLEGVLETRADDLHGILNGVDYALWNPATDGYLKQRYSVDDLSGKQACQADLLKRMGLEDKERERGAVGHRTPPMAGAAARRPVAGFVSRLTEQKGMEVFVDAIEDLVRAGVVLAILGKGERKYEDMLVAAARQFPGRVAVKIAHDEELAHQIQAGADMLLVPSRFEPCGLTQLYALKYGTIPVVRATGGLEDTVADFDERTGGRAIQGTGFKFALYKSAAFVGAVRRAILLHNQPQKWQKLMRNAMACDFSWQASAKEYEKLYAALSAA